MTTNLILSSTSNEWYTPAIYIDAARDVLGEIDLDPASCAYAQRTVRAKKYYTMADDGLRKTWQGKVFLNPPYGRTCARSNQSLWSEKLIREFEAGRVTEAILLTNAQTAEKWFQPLWAYSICFTNHRIKFELEDGQKSQPTHGNAFTYMGQNVAWFKQVFSRFGKVVY